MLNAVMSTAVGWQGGEEKYTMLRHLQKVSKLFGNALESNRGGVAISTLGDDKDEETKAESTSTDTDNRASKETPKSQSNYSNEIDNQKGIKYNRNGIYIYDKQEYAKLAQELARRNGNKPRKVEFASTDNYFYIVKDNKVGSFTAVLQVEIVGNEDFVNELRRGIDNGSYSTASTISEWLRVVQSRERSNNWDNDFSKEARPDGQTNAIYGESSKGNTRGYIGRDGRNSTIDSVGNTLTESQQEYFKDSKVRDKEGNLLVVYHGTNNDFFTFDNKTLGRGSLC